MNSVLIVDDEEAIREFLSRWLTAGGFDVRTAAGADQALVAMTTAAADVVMCDVEMPGHNGLWLAAQLHQRFPASAIVLATSLDSVPPMTSMQPGIVEYLVKPFTQERVLRAAAAGVAWHDVALRSRANVATGTDPLSHWLKSTTDEELPPFEEPKG